MHEQELQQLAAENARLRRQLESLRQAPSDAAQNIASKDVRDPTDEGRSGQAQVKEPKEHGQAYPPLAARSSEVDPPSQVLSVLPGAIEGSTDVFELLPKRPHKGADDTSWTLPVEELERDGKSGIGEAKERDTKSSIGEAKEQAFPLKEGWVASDLPPEGRGSLRGAKRIAKAIWSESHTPSKYVASPNDPGRAVWDVIGAGLIWYDLWVIPLQQSFDPSGSAFLITMDWVTLVYWSIDIPLTLQVGFVRGGEIIRNPREILLNYLKTWFLVDLAVVVPDWIFTLEALGSQHGKDTLSSLKLVRVLRLARLLRLVRLLRLARIVQRFNAYIQSERANIFVNITKMLVLLVVIVHYVGCSWFLIARSQGGSDTWLKVHQFDDESWPYQYITSFHWAVTQFTPASMHVQPQNLAERIFAVLVVLFGLVGFSYVVGSITGSLTQLRSLSEETQKQFWMVRRFLKQNDVPLDLSARITRYLERAWEARRKTVQLKDHKIFSLLSEQLRSELRLEIWMPQLRKHDLLRELADMGTRCLPRLAAAALELDVFFEGDHVFLEGKAKYMYIRITGDLIYERRDHFLVEVNRPYQVFIAEPILWTSAWKHLGILTADVYAQLLRLDPENFMKTMNESPNALAAADRYARRFVRSLQEIEMEDLSDIAEISAPPPKTLLARVATQVPDL